MVARFQNEDALWQLNIHKFTYSLAQLNFVVLLQRGGSHKYENAKKSIHDDVCHKYYLKN